MVLPTTLLNNCEPKLYLERRLLELTTEQRQRVQKTWQQYAENCFDLFGINASFFLAC